MEECVKAASNIGFPVALKIDSPEVAHKTEAGGLSLDIRDEGRLKKEIDRLKSRFGGTAQRYIVQEYVTGGTEVIVGCKRVEGVGHVVMFGLGGVLVEIMKDVVFRFAPVAKRTALKMIKSTRCFPILQGYRGRETVDTDRLAEILMRTSQLVIDIPDIQELDLNPIVAYGDPSRTAAVDVLLKVSP